LELDINEHNNREKTHDHIFIMIKEEEEEKNENMVVYSRATSSVNLSSFIFKDSCVYFPLSSINIALIFSP
jgi:hypothetical protein